MADTACFAHAESLAQIAHTDSFHLPIACIASFSYQGRHCLLHSCRLTHTDSHQLPIIYIAHSFSNCGRHYSLCSRIITHTDSCHLPIIHSACTISDRGRHCSLRSNRSTHTVIIRPSLVMLAHLALAADKLTQTFVICPFLALIIHSVIVADKDIHYLPIARIASSFRVCNSYSSLRSCKSHVWPTRYPRAHASCEH